MALNETGEPSSGIFASIKGALGLFDSVNKANFVSEESSPLAMGEFESSLSDVQIIQLQRHWRESYTPYYSDIEKSQRIAFKYWIGSQDTADVAQLQGGQPAVDNLIFEAIETFLPIATRANPDPVVTADPSPEGQDLARDLKNGLVYEADRQKLRMLNKRAARHWMIYRIAVVKFCWNPITQRIETKVVNPKRMVFDKNGFVDFDAAFKGEFLGEKHREPASEIIKKFPKSKEYIKTRAQNKLGTYLEYFEWWYQDTDFFFTMEEHVLGKYKNVHWNYDGEQVSVDPETGAETVTEIKGDNHLDAPSAPYRFLSIFSTGLQPHDETSLIMQNIGLQDMVNRRLRQIDHNVERMNNSLVVNGRSFTDDQASLAATAMRQGKAIRVPSPQGTGLTNDVMNFPAEPIPVTVYQNLQDIRGELRNIFGTSGSTPGGEQTQQDTARGQILINQMDSSRIGGGVTEYIEQLDDAIYNYWVQMMYVYYDTPHYMTVSGLNGGKELAVLHNARFGLTQTLDITVKEGSLIPKDPLTQRNEAIELWSANAIDPRTLYTKLDYPDPNEATKQLILWQQIQKGDPQALAMYMPDFAQQAAQQPGLPQTQPGTGGPAVNMEAPQPQQPTPPGSPGAVAEQGKQLEQSVPLK